MPSAPSTTAPGSAVTAAVGRPGPVEQVEQGDRWDLEVGRRDDEGRVGCRSATSASASEAEPQGRQARSAGAPEHTSCLQHCGETAGRPCSPEQDDVGAGRVAVDGPRGASPTQGHVLAGHDPASESALYCSSTSAIGPSPSSRPERR